MTRNPVFNVESRPKDGAVGTHNIVKRVSILEMGRPRPNAPSHVFVYVCKIIQIYDTVTIHTCSESLVYTYSAKRCWFLFLQRVDTYTKSIMLKFSGYPDSDLCTHRSILTFDAFHLRFLRVQIIIQRTWLSLPLPGTQTHISRLDQSPGL